MQNRQNQRQGQRPRQRQQAGRPPRRPMVAGGQSTGQNTSQSTNHGVSRNAGRSTSRNAAHQVRSLETRPSAAPGQARRRAPLGQSDRRSKPAAPARGGAAATRSRATYTQQSSVATSGRSRQHAPGANRGSGRKVPDALPVEKTNTLARLRDKFRKQPAITEIVREPTAGGIVFRFTPDQKDIEILLIQDSKNRWTIPKGHIEPGETAKQTAIREIGEEAGLFHIQVLTWLGKIHFKYRRVDKLVLMTTQIYLVRSLDKTEAPTKEKWMHGIQWFSFADALEAIEYEDIEKLILIAKKKIRNGEY